MNYLLMAYGDEKKCNALTPEEWKDLAARCQAYDEELKKTGRVVASGSLGWGSTAMRLNAGKLNVTDGPFIEANEVVGGFVIIEARDLNEAIQIASLHPAARTGENLGWGIELRPMERCELEKHR